MPSTMLSRNLSLACAELEFGNVVLEDIILAELNGKSGTINGVVHHLKSSIKALFNAKGSCESLRQIMNEAGFADPLILKSVDLIEIGKKFTQAQMVSPKSWQAISAMIKEGGFQSILNFFAISIDDLREKTENLLSQVIGLSDAVDTGLMTEILEGNLPGNIKPAFAKLYTAWADFNSDFLASSILSTELWYIRMDSGSLLLQAQGILPTEKLMVA